MHVNMMEGILPLVTVLISGFDPSLIVERYSMFCFVFVRPLNPILGSILMSISVCHAPKEIDLKIEQNKAKQSKIEHSNTIQNSNASRSERAVFRQFTRGTSSSEIKHYALRII